MRAILLVALALGGCGGGASYAGWTEARAHAPGAQPGGDAPLALGAMVFVGEGASEPFAVLEENGRLHRRDCERVIASDGTVRDAASEALVLQLVRREGSDVSDVLGEDDVLRFHLEGGRLLRPDASGAARIEDAAVRFEGSPAITLRVEGGGGDALRRTALLVIAALATCDG